MSRYDPGMQTLRHHAFTLEAYLDLDARSDERFEFLGGGIFVMAGASPQHNRIALKTAGALDRRVGRTCHAFGAEQRVVTGDGLYTYPDALVACGKLDVLLVQGTGTVRNPSLVVEVLSPSTRDYDLGEKLEHYQSTPSLREVLLIEQDRVDVLHVRRSPQSLTGWEQERFLQLSDAVTLLSVRRTLTLQEIYARAFEI